jgi:hypothetical protein
MITYAEIKASPSGWKDLVMEDFELALAELIDTYRNKIDRQDVTQALQAQGERVAADDGWTKAEDDDEDADT